MLKYRCYLLDRLGAIRAVEVLKMDHDDCAIALARRVLEGRPQYRALELWRGLRRVHLETNVPASS